MFIVSIDVENVSFVANITLMVPSAEALTRWGPFRATASTSSWNIIRLLIHWILILTYRMCHQWSNHLVLCSDEDEISEQIRWWCCWAVPFQDPRSIIHGEHMFSIRHPYLLEHRLLVHHKIDIHPLKEPYSIHPYQYHLTRHWVAAILILEQTKSSISISVNTLISLVIIMIL